MKPTIIHNDTCPICSREVKFYQSTAQAAGVALEVQGLDGPARTQFGLSQDDAAKRFHVIQDGQLLSGLDAFIVVWETLPRFRWLARIIRPRAIRVIADPIYDHILAPILFAMHKRRHRRAAAKT